MVVGFLAKEWCNLRLPLQVLHSQLGFYIGTSNENGPVSRESEECWKTRKMAEHALAHDEWTQKLDP